MSLGLLTEHHDFLRARRALTVAAVSLFIVTSLDLQSDFIEIFGLKLGVSKPALVLAGRLAVVYLGMIFGALSMSSTLERNPTLLDDALASTLEKIQRELVHYLKHVAIHHEHEIRGREVPPEVVASLQSGELNVGILSTNAEDALVRELTRGVRQRLWLRMLTDFCLPLLLAASALIYSFGT